MIISFTKDVIKFESWWPISKKEFMNSITDFIFWNISFLH